MVIFIVTLIAVCVVWFYVYITGVKLDNSDDPINDEDDDDPIKFM